MKINANNAYKSLDLQNGESYSSANGVTISRDESGRLKLEGTPGKDAVSGAKDSNGYMLMVEPEGGDPTVLKLSAEEAAGLQVDMGDGDDEYWFDGSYDAAGEIQDLKGNNRVSRAPGNISGEVSSEMGALVGSFSSAPNVVPKKPTPQSQQFARDKARNESGAAALAQRLQKMVPTEAPTRPEGLGSLQSQAWDAMDQGQLLTNVGGFGGGTPTATFLHDPSGALDRETLAQRGKAAPFDGHEPYAHKVRPNFSGADGRYNSEPQSLQIEGPNGAFTVRKGEPNFDAFSKLFQHAKQQKPLVGLLS